MTALEVFLIAIGITMAVGHRAFAALSFETHRRNGFPWSQATLERLYLWGGLAMALVSLLILLTGGVD
jgi:hypothetical protein